jgi:malonyl-CoA/methylmalonyl-CoA synthetase
VNANLYALIKSHFPAGPEAPCLIVPGGPVIHYDDLAAMSSRIARALRAAGCAPGDRVAVQAGKHWQAVALYLACLRSGLVYLPLNTDYRRSELEFFFADAKPRVIVCGLEHLGVVETIAAGATVLAIDARGGELIDRAEQEPAVFETVQSRPDDVAALLYTSGTTGRAKGAMLTHRNLSSNALALVEAWEFDEHDTLLHALPIYHVHGLFVALHCVLLSGSRALWLDRFDAKEVISLLPRTSVMMGVPTFYTRLLAEPSLDRAVAAQMRLFVSGSAPLLAETFHDFEARTGHRILERYGMTETGMNTSNPLRGERIAGTVGRPLAGVSVRVVDGSGASCAAGTVGSIEVRGPNVFAGYWNLPERTKQEFTTDGWFRTGDLGRWTQEGHLAIVGRSKDLIISGGLNVYPKEVEERIDAMPGVVESAVVGIPDADFGEVGLAVVVARPGHPMSEASIIAALKEEIAPYKVPKRVLFAPELPRNAMGKVQKSVLRERYSPKAGRGARDEG